MISALQAIEAAIRRRRVALLCGVAVMAVGTLAAFASPFSHSWQGIFVWPPSHLFLPYNDLWQSWVSSNLIAHGGYTHVFQNDVILRTVPGWVLITAPISRLISELGFTTTRSLWWVVGPLYFSPVLVFFCAADRWMEGLSLARRLVVFATAGRALLPSTYGGHPEDVLAIGCALYALHASRSERPAAAGWWLGAALAFQLDAVLLVPICLAIVTRDKWKTVVVRAAIVPAIIAVFPIVMDPRLALTRLLQLNKHNTGPLPVWASPLTHVLSGRFSAVWDLFIVLGAVAIGWWVSTWKAFPRDRLLWAAALVLSLRLFEPFFLNYYITVAFATLAVAASFRTWWRQLAVTVDVVFLTWWSWFPLYRSWLHWAGLVVLVGLGLLTAAPDVRFSSLHRVGVLARFSITRGRHRPAELTHAHTNGTRVATQGEPANGSVASTDTSTGGNGRSSAGDGQPARMSGSY